MLIHSISLADYLCGICLLALKINVLNRYVYVMTIHSISLADYLCGIYLLALKINVLNRYVYVMTIHSVGHRDYLKMFVVGAIAIPRPLKSLHIRCCISPTRRSIAECQQYSRYAGMLVAC